MSKIMSVKNFYKLFPTGPFICYFFDDNDQKLIDLDKRMIKIALKFPHVPCFRLKLKTWKRTNIGQIIDKFTVFFAMNSKIHEEISDPNQDEISEYFQKVSKLMEINEIINPKPPEYQTKKIINYDRGISYKRKNKPLTDPSKKLKNEAISDSKSISNNIQTEEKVKLDKMKSFYYNKKLDINHAVIKGPRRYSHTEICSNKILSSYYISKDDTNKLYTPKEMDVSKNEIIESYKRKIVCPKKRFLAIQRESYIKFLNILK